MRGLVPKGDANTIRRKRTTFKERFCRRTYAKAGGSRDRGEGDVLFGRGWFEGFLPGFFEFAVGYAGRRPGLGEMVGIELVEFAAPTRYTTDDDMFVVTTAFFMRTHGSVIHFDGRNKLQIAHSASVGCGNFGVWNISRNDAFQTVFNDRF